MKVDVLLEAWAEWSARGENRGGKIGSRLNSLMAGSVVSGGSYCSMVPVELLDDDGLMMEVDKAISELSPCRRKVIRVEYLEPGSHADKVGRFDPPLKVQHYRNTLVRAKMNLQQNKRLKHILFKPMLKEFD